MTDNTVIDYTAIANAAAEAEDQTKMKEGGKGFDRPVPVAGSTVVRLQQYIEVGKQKAKRKDFKDTEEVMLRFELHAPKHLIEIDTEEGKKKIPSVIDITLPKGGSTSKYGRLFTALNYSGKYNHFSQMVGKGSWLAEVTHNVVGKGTDDEKVYANLDKNKAWTFAAPVVDDPISGARTALSVPELSGEPKLFLFENKGLNDQSYLALWNTLFIEGEHEAKGDKPAKSKNWIQEKIKNSLTFKESRLCKLLGENPDGVDVDALVESAEQGNESTSVEQSTQSTESSPTAQEDTVEESTSSGTNSTDTTETDPLLDLL